MQNQQDELLKQSNKKHKKLRDKVTQSILRISLLITPTA